MATTGSSAELDRIGSVSITRFPVVRRGAERVKAFFRKGGLDRELDAEVASHLEFAIENDLQRGMS